MAELGCVCRHRQERDYHRDRKGSHFSAPTQRCCGVEANLEIMAEKEEPWKDGIPVRSAPRLTTTGPGLATESLLGGLTAIPKISSILRGSQRYVPKLKFGR